MKECNLLIYCLFQFVIFNLPYDKYLNLKKILSCWLSIMKRVKKKFKIFVVALASNKHQVTKVVFAFGSRPTSSLTTTLSKKKHCPDS